MEAAPAQRRAQPAARPARAADLAAGADDPHDDDPRPPRPEPALPARPARLRPPRRRTRAGPAARASRCSSCSTTKKAARTACCTATPAARHSCPRCSPAPAYADRHMSMEGIYEYGSRVGVWRILREFERRGLPLTVFGVGMALRALPRADRGLRRTRPRDRLPRLRWIHYQNMRRGHRARAHAAWRCSCIKRADRRARRWAGTPAATARTRAAWWPTSAASNTTATTTATTCRSGCRCSKTDGSDWCRTWSCPTRWTATTCASRCRRASPRRPVLRLPARQLRRAVCRRRRGDPKMMSIGMHCRLLGRPGRIARAAALSRPHRRRTTASGCAGASTSRATGRRRIPSTGDRLRLGVTPCAADARPAQRRHRSAEFVRAAGRHLRALALDRRGALARSGRSPRWRAQAGAGRRWCARPAASAQLALIRAHPELAGKAMVSQDADRRIHQRAGQGRPHRLHARGVRAHPAAQRRLQRQASAFPSSWRCAGRAARACTRREIIATFERRLHNHPDFELAECLRNIHRIAEIRLNDKFGVRARAGQPGLGLGRALAAAQRPGLRRARRAHRHLPHRRAPRLRAAAVALDARDCGFDEVRDRRGRQRGRRLPRQRSATPGGCSPAATTTPCATAASTTGAWASSCRWPACASCTAPAGACPSASRWSASPKRKASATRPPSSARAR